MPCMIRIETSAFIPAPPQRVWDVLIDFAAYPDWNPLVLRAEGRAAAGARVRLLLAHPDLSGRKGWLWCKVDEWCPGERLGWTGGPWPILRGHHWFSLSDEKGGTRLTHGENLTGLYPWLHRHTLGRRFRPGYEALNEALRRRLEQTSA